MCFYSQRGRVDCPLGRREDWANYFLPGPRKFTAPHRAAGGECQLEMFEGREHLWIDKPGPMTDMVLRRSVEPATQISHSG
jgi:hypothetical protein